ncbi:MAG: glycosyltransferase [Wenzhouxiangella sp.]|nr:glycosyltransferase [Wenzhouxiangella sp.]TVR94676.1 MAG: glycosyltransferase [Wenzhouxiangellaceae bacterium]
MDRREPLISSEPSPDGLGGKAGRDEDEVRPLEQLLALSEQGQRARARRAEASLAEILNSTSWRISAPLRTPLAWLFGWRLRLRRQLARHDWIVRTYLALRRRIQPWSRSAGLDHGMKEKHRRQAEARLDAFLAGADDLPLPCAETPLVSIILVLYNRAELTLDCLRSIIAHADLPVELLLVDNASSDRTGELLARLQGVKVLSNVENRGFVVAVNQAAAEARGQHLLLLNNDAELLPGALTAALNAIESAGDIGAVGGRILLLDGSLQEAGSIIFADGSCMGYGRGQDSDAPAFRFRREVDYCSGAFLLTPRRLFERLGGFDEAFAPAYYEETDYCMRLRRHGFRVLYEPAAAIRHVEFASSVSSEQALALQAKHRALFVERHRDALRDQPQPDPSRALFARSAGSQRRLLIIDDRVPHVELGAGYPRAGDLIRALLRLGHSVTLYPTIKGSEDWGSVYRSMPPELEVMQGPGLLGLPEFVAARRGYYDRVLISRPHNLARLPVVLGDLRAAFPGAELIYDAEAVVTPRETARRRLYGEQIDASEARRELESELALADLVDRVIAVSAREAALFEHGGRTAVHVLGHRLELQPTSQPFVERSGFLFVGALRDDESPNVDSLLWFCEHVAPRLRAELGPAFRLFVAGDASASRLAGLDADWLHLLGRLDSLELVFSACRVFIAPTRFAAGIPHKLHDAAARGLPAVATSLLAEQLGWQAGKELLVADTAADFADACLALYRDALRWQSIREAALFAVERDGSPASFDASVAGLFGSGRPA